MAGALCYNTSVIRKGENLTMLSKIIEMNRSLRRLFLILGGLFALAKLTEKKNTFTDEDKDGYQTKEFDDIW